MKIAHQCKDYGVTEIILSSVVATSRVNAEILIHFKIKIIDESLQGKWVLFCK